MTRLICLRHLCGLASTKDGLFWRDLLVLSHPAACLTPHSSACTPPKQFYTNLFLFLHPFLETEIRQLVYPANHLSQHFTLSKLYFFLQVHKVHKVYYQEVVWWLYCSHHDHHHWCNLLFQLTIPGTSHGSHPGHCGDLGEKQTQWEKDICPLVSLMFLLMGGHSFHTFSQV